MPIIDKDMAKGMFRKILSRASRGAGLHVVTNDDYSLLQTAKKELLPLTRSGDTDYLPKREIGHAGFSLNEESQISIVRSFAESRLSSLYKVLRDSKEINKGFNGIDFSGKGLIHNGYYPTPDAEIYAAMISKHRPKRILEIGSGFSTLIAREAVKFNDLDCQIHVIDPCPRRDVEVFADHIEYKPVECSSLVQSGVAPDTLLFIDSSHVCKGGGDLPFLYCRILPELPKGIIIHIHDIFTPYDYPDNYFDRFYTEEYLLGALLANSNKFNVLLATHYLSRKHPALMQEVFGPSVGRDPLFFGASFWMQTIGA